MAKPFHGYYDEQIGLSTAVDLQLMPELQFGKKITVQQRSLSYLFKVHFHPYVSKFVRRLLEESIPGLQSIDTEYLTKPDGSFVTLPDGKPKPVFFEQLFSASKYNPSSLTEKPHPVKDIDFSSSGAYSVYNWELFFHVPLTIAMHLSKSQRFEDAMRWFHYIFDPTDSTQGPTPDRFWKAKPFQFTDVKKIEEILVNLSTGADPELQQDTIDAINAWKASPFRPHVVARFRQTAYMFKTVMAYLDNLIAWGDSLFRQDTGETVNEAQQLYVLAANILGPRPQAVPKKGSVRPQTYFNFKNDLDAFSNALVEFEGDVPFDNSATVGDKADDGQLNAVLSIGNALYFCVPRNDKLLSYWDTVADRLFKIRNSLNLRGIFRQLPLFEPPIDPALLARAAASGLNVAAIVAGLNQPLPLVRFQLLLQKASEICQEVKSLGNNLLTAIEKEDNEALSILRARHERVILGLVEAVKYAQWQETIKARQGLEDTLANAAQRFTYYERLLGTDPSEIKIPELDDLDTASLFKMKFKQGDPVLGLREIEIDITKDTKGISEGKKISSYEVREMELLEDARGKQDSAAMYEMLSSEMAMIPEFGAQAQPMGAGAAVKFGGMFLAKMFSMMAMAERTGGDQLNYQAGKAAKIGNYARREQDWAYQSNLAAAEITQLFKQLRAAQIREALAEREWTTHQKQIQHAEEIERFLTDEKNGKTSNRAFYVWLRREVKGLYSQSFQLAFDIAKKAERALQHELGDPNLIFLQFGYFSGKEGLLAGEKLHLDLKRMEMAYHDLNEREYELTKHVSLLQLNPKGLLQLRTVGRCTVFLPEELFDLDCPGHYFRRIKSVALSIPCVVGPYSSVNCTLTLLKSSIRRTSLLGEDGYARNGAEDSRFSDHFGSLQSIVTSTGQSDSGMFDVNQGSERYLPFEGSGAVSEWQLELPSDIRQFNYDTISDVILHIRYTAREGGTILRNAAVGNLKAGIEEAQMLGTVRLLSVRHEFPMAWAKFKSGPNGSPWRELSLDLREEHYPFWSKGSLEEIKRVDIYARTTKANVDVNTQPSETGKRTLVADASLGNLKAGKLENVKTTNAEGEVTTSPVGKLNLYLKDQTITDVWLAVAWGKE
jgi:hypothetical protein